MKIKLIGILVCIMLVSTFVTVAQPPENATNSTLLTAQTAASNSVDVPVWNIGDSWTYKIDTISINYTNGATLVHLDATAGALPLTVSDTTGESYTLSFNTTMSGHISIYTDQGGGPVNVSITFTDISLAGNVIIEKSTLGVKELSASFIKQKFVIDIYQQPYIKLPPFLQHINAKVTMNTTINCDTPLALLAFPLNTMSAWNLSSTNITLNGKIESGWFHLIKFINDIAYLFNYTLIPPDIAALLPVIDIKDALTTLGAGNVFQLPEVDDAFYCLTTENVTVPAGTYNAYNITILDGLAAGYYAPVAGNIVKLTGNFESIIPYVTDINMELLSTNYS
jgi:hypothetical protein